MMAPDATASPCLNVPDWFVQDGGELVISETATGTSILRYWPRFMTDKGSNVIPVTHSGLHLSCGLFCIMLSLVAECSISFAENVSKFTPYCPLASEESSGRRTMETSATTGGMVWPM